MFETAITAGDAPARSVPPARVGRYSIEGLLGAGGMGVVYLARDPALDREIALKVIDADGDPRAAARLVREAQALARVVHPNVLHVYEVGREHERVYIAMERIVGLTLTRWLADAPRTRREILEVFADAGRGLAAAHAAGLVHRDFKPDNVMIDRAGRVRVVDFGLARSAHETDDASAETFEPRAQGSQRGALLGVTAAGAIVGTPAYMSPEQWRGLRPNQRSDQFSFCVALAHALTGEHPFETMSNEVLRAAVIDGRARPLPRSLPAALRAVVRRGLAANPDDRFASMDAIVSALAPRRRRAVAGGLAFATVGCVAAVAVAATPTTAPAAIAYRAPVPITSRGDIGTATVSPDGEQLALLTRDALVVQPVTPGGASRTLLRGRLSYYTLAWSPDSRTLALVAAIAGRDTRDPGLVVVDVATGDVRRISENLGHVALLGGDDFATARFAGDHVAFRSLRDPQHAHVCRLPPPFTGIRSLRADRGSVLVQLDRSDSETTLVRVDRACTTTTAMAQLPSLAYTVRAGDHRILARELGRNDLVEIDAAGAPTAARHLVQSSDYQPLAARADGTLVHLDRSTRWSLASTAGGDLLGGTGESRFAISPDHVTVAQVDGVYRRGLLRIGRLDDLRPDLPIVAERVARVAWSPDGRRLALLSQGEHGYEVATLDVGARTTSAAHPVAIPYDVEMTWIDDRRVAFGVPHDYHGFLVVDTDTGATSTLAVGDGEATHSLARAHADGRLAYVTETATEIRAWTFVDGLAAGGRNTRPRLAAAIAVTSPRSARRPQVVWSADDRALFVVDDRSGELWSVAVATGAITRLPDLALPRSGGFPEVADLFALPDRLVVATVTRSADVFVSRPLD